MGAGILVSRHPRWAVCQQPFVVGPGLWVIVHENNRGLWSSGLSQQHTLKAPEGTALLPAPDREPREALSFHLFHCGPRRSAQLRNYMISDCILCAGSPWTYQAGSDASLPKIFLVNRDMRQPAFGFLLCNKLALLVKVSVWSRADAAPGRRGSGPTWKVRLTGVQLSADYRVTFDLPEVLPFYGPMESKVSH